MSLPKVRFKKMDISENLDSLVWCSNPKNSKNSPLDFYKKTLMIFPELEGKIHEGMSDYDIYMVLDREVKPILENLYNDSNDVEKYQTIWDKVSDQIMIDLENKLDCKWPENIEVVARICLLPCLSRDIMGRTFDVNYGGEADDVIETAIHELCHIIYYEKWMQIFPDYSEEEFDNPHIAWYLSEAMIDPLINNETFRKYTKGDLTCYTVFYETYLEDGKSVVDILRDYVREYPIGEAIKKGYELFKKYEDIIKNCDKSK